MLATDEILSHVPCRSRNAAASMAPGLVVVSEEAESFLYRLNRGSEVAVAAECCLRRDLRKGEVERDCDSGEFGGEDGREAAGDEGEEG